MTTNNEAREFIYAIASNMKEVKKLLSSVLEVLEDGGALADLGVTAEDQALVEEAHALVASWIDAGNETLCQV